MKRRRFLRQVGVTAIGSGGVLASVSAQSPESADVVSQQNSPRRVLVTSADSKVARAIADALAADYDVRLTAPSEGSTRHVLPDNELGDHTTINSLVRDMDAIVHVAQPATEASEQDQIDFRTRGTYNLLRSAVEEGVRHVIYLSSLQILTAYDEQFEVTEDWRPLPSDDAQVLSHYLGEFTCREFARQGGVGVVVLRLGKIVQADEAAKEPFDPLWVDQRDVVQAVSKVLEARLSGTGPLARAWSVFHIQSGSSQARFTSARAKSEFGYAPQFPLVHDDA